MSQHLLFSSVNIFDVMYDRKSQLRDQVNECTLSELQDNELPGKLVKRFSLEVPVLNEQEKHATHREVKVDVSRDLNRYISDRSRPFLIPATEVTIHVPFKGEPGLFDVRPSTFNSAEPIGDVDNHELLLAYNIIEGRDFTPELQRTLGEIKRHLGWLQPSATQLETELRQAADSLISDRKKRLTENQNVLEKLGIPMRPISVETRPKEKDDDDNDDRTRPQDWDVFICHATEDKAEIARPLAEALRERGLSVWYDEFSLKLGDSLRQSIDRGLARSRYGVVILSPRFFEKHWPQQELNGLASREVDGQKVIIPLWHELGVDEVRRQSPILADRLAARTDEGLENLVEKILDAISVEAIVVEPNPSVSNPQSSGGRTRGVSNRQRFAVGARVRVKNPGINGTVIEVADESTVMGEYWHKIQTQHGERDEPGSNLELIPKTQS